MVAEFVHYSYEEVGWHNDLVAAFKNHLRIVPVII